MVEIVGKLMEEKDGGFLNAAALNWNLFHLKNPLVTASTLKYV